ncbi:MAG: cytochrome c-type biogenesis protein, partial [Gammaproteobacteria bacterium]
DDDISQFMVDRYGDFVLYDPPFRISTALLWVGPFVVLAGGLIAVRKLASGRKGTGAAVSDNERNRAHKLLSGEGDK